MLRKCCMVQQHSSPHHSVNLRRLWTGLSSTLKNGNHSSGRRTPESIRAVQHFENVEPGIFGTAAWGSTEDQTERYQQQATVISGALEMIEYALVEVCQFWKIPEGWWYQTTFGPFCSLLVNCQLQLHFHDLTGTMDSRPREQSPCLIWNPSHCIGSREIFPKSSILQLILGFCGLVPLKVGRLKFYGYSLLPPSAYSSAR